MRSICCASFFVTLLWEDSCRRKELMILSNKVKKEIKPIAKNNKRYSIEEKQRLIKRMLPPENYLVTKLSNETGIHKSNYLHGNQKL